MIGDQEAGTGPLNYLKEYGGPAGGTEPNGSEEGIQKNAQESMNNYPVMHPRMKRKTWHSSCPPRHTEPNLSYH